METFNLHRRSLIRGAALGAAGALSPALAGAHLLPFQKGRKTKRVVLVAFAGGVRTRETFGTPDNIPNMRQMADEGVLYTNVATANLGHFGATMSIFTGISEPRGIRENARGEDPTLFEYLRKGLGMPKEDIWVTTTGGAQQVNYSYSVHPEYGSKYGANILDGEGIFNAEFKQLLDTWGMPKSMGDKEKALLDALRKGVGGGVDAVREAERLARVEDYILKELTQGTTDITGAAAGDRKALRLARNLLSLFRPKVVGVVLQNADVAHGSYNAYSEVVRQNDAAIGELVSAIREDEELAASTAVIVLPEFGRDRDLNSRRGLDHGDGSPDLRRVTCLAWGPDFKRGVEIDSQQRTTDVVGTVCELFGTTAPLTRGGRLRGLYS